MIRIVLVEDEDIIRKGMQYTIDWLSMGATVVGVAENGEDGLEQIALHQPDLVITDIKMPVMDGLTMIEKGIELGFSFLSVILTSYSDFEYAKQSIHLQVFDYLLKPINEEVLKKLIKKIEQALENERSIPVADISSYSQVFNSTIDNPHVEYALNKIKKSYTQHLSIEQIAGELQISPSYLSRVFKQKCAKTFLDFLNGYRVQKAVELLSTKKYKVYEVADMTGFSEYKRFYQIFKDYTTVSPTDFVKNGYSIIVEK